MDRTKLAKLSIIELHKMDNWNIKVKYEYFQNNLKQD